MNETCNVQLVVTVKTYDTCSHTYRLRILLHKNLNTTLFSMNKYLGAYRVQNVHAIQIMNFGLTEVRGYGGCFFEGGHLIIDVNLASNNG